MADLGADVIMIEAPWARGGATVDEISVMATRFYPDNDPGDEHWNRNGFSNKFNINKRNVSLDLSKPGGTDVLADLVKSADVLIENYSPRVMPQFGLDEHRLHELNPSLIYVTMPGFGRTGPMQDRVAYGPIVDSQGGLSVLMGYEGESARKAGVAWPDPAAGIHAAFAAVAAVVDRAADGQGRTVELAQLEVTVAMAGHAVIDRQLTGVEPTPTGNRHRRLAPQGVYRCAGDDRWLAISVIDQESWTGLCNAAGFESDWFRWTEAERRSATELIDQRLTAWTSTAAPEDLMVRLQAASVPAAAVQDAARVMADPHHADRAFFVDITHPVAGTHSWPRVPIRLTETPASYRTPGANLNQHGAEVLRQVAGYDEAKINELRARSILADRPPD
jgi:crotonobetainyl-CoA:carnitine CoA-transferase CaiB-like acyl-CoA transferase